MAFVKLGPHKSKRKVTFIARTDGVSVWVSDDRTGEVSGTRRLVSRADFVDVLKDEIAKLKTSMQ
jgi:hypothetical protein